MQIYEDINKYYTNKIEEFGPSSEGVDWNGEESQFIRFKQLSKIIKTLTFSINDVGCGYGKYVDFLESNFKDFTYFGYDLSKKMIQSASELYIRNNYSFYEIENIQSLKESDYSISSGIFNVKMQYSDNDWLQYILESLNEINQKSKKGFSFNMLTKYSDEEYMKDNLYYADPLFIFDYCKKNFSKNVSLLHDYGLYEFTILVRKDIL